MDLGFIFIDPRPVLVFFSQGASDVLWQLFAIGGWVILAQLLLFAGITLYVNYRQDKHTAHWKWVVLAVDMPALNVQTPKAVEQMFNHLAGALEHSDLVEHFVGGHKQLWYSLEIISIEGYIQFIIRTEENLRDLVEAAIYAQYPDVEITEVEDYVSSVPDRYPNDEYEMWASDFTLSEMDAFPIRTYREFEHSISKDTVLKDPMGAFLESFTRIGPGEQVWFQILIEPTGNQWKEHAIERIKEMIGEEGGHHGVGNKFLDALGSAPLKLLEIINTEVFGAVPEEGGHDEGHKEGPKNQIQYLTPGQKKLVEDMETKISHVGFKTKIRAVYVARKEVFNKRRVVHALVGAINQYNVPSSNSIVSSYGVSASYFFKKRRIAKRKNLLMKAYKKRKMRAGANPFILNVEELATIWHFPMSHVKTPLVQKAMGKKSEPPAGLPVETIVPNLPVVEEDEMKFG